MMVKLIRWPSQIVSAKHADAIRPLIHHPPATELDFHLGPGYRLSRKDSFGVGQVR